MAETTAATSTCATPSCTAPMSLLWMMVGPNAFTTSGADRCETAVGSVVPEGTRTPRATSMAFTSGSGMTRSLIARDG